MKILTLALISAAAFAGTSAQAAGLAFNSKPADGWFYGSGNNYTNSAVLTTAAGDQLALRLHKTFELAPASTGHIYSFALGTDPLSFDWGVDNNAGAAITALITLKNIKSGQTFSYNPFGTPNTNFSNGTSTQNSARVNWFPVGFNPNVDGSYRVTLDVDGLAGGPQKLSVTAQFGAGAVPEPATWAMMIGGFGLVGGAMRRRNVAIRFA